MKTVALIDDDPGVLEALGMLLTSRGLHHASYSSADAFLSAPPCGGCVVSDLRMPGLNGLELLTALQSIHDQRPVILLTAHGDVELAVRALKAVSGPPSSSASCLSSGNVTKACRTGRGR